MKTHNKLMVLALSIVCVAFARSASAVIVNLAPGGTATATSETNGTTASQAIDGIGIGGANFPAIWHSGNELNPALTVNLGNVYNLGDDSPAGDFDVILSNRADCCGGRLTNLRLEVFGSGGTGGPVLASVDFDPAGALTFGVEFPAVAGQFVRLTKLNAPGSPVDDNRSINLAEIEIFGDNVPVPEPSTTALAVVGLIGFCVQRMRRR